MTKRLSHTSTQMIAIFPFMLGVFIATTSEDVMAMGYASLLMSCPAIAACQVSKHNEQWDNQ